MTDHTHPVDAPGPVRHRHLDCRLNYMPYEDGLYASTPIIVNPADHTYRGLIEMYKILSFSNLLGMA